MRKINMKKYLGYRLVWKLEVIDIRILELS